MGGAGFILALGGANMDIIADAGQALCPGDSTPGRVSFFPGGVARNVAHNLALLGHAVRLVSAVGDDAQGHALLAATRQAGVDVSGCRVLTGVATAAYVSVHDAGGEVVMAVNDMQVLEQLSPELLEPLGETLSRAAVLVLDCNLSDAALGWLFAQRRSAPVFVDAVSAHKCRRLLPWLDRVHTLKLNRLEAQALSGLPVERPAEVEAVAGWLHGRGVPRVVVSLGAEGLYHSAADRSAAPGRPGREHGRQAALSNSAGVLNTTGAGDALMAGLVHSHLNHRPLAQAVRFAAACAALTVTALSANHPELSVARVEQLLDTLPSA
jgi:pseudouridine kinase